MQTFNVGDKAVVVNTSYGSVPDGTLVTICGVISDTCYTATVDGGDGFDWCFNGYQLKPLYDTDATKASAPKLWRDMTPEEKGALLLAHHEGKVIEWTRSPGDTEFLQDSTTGARPVWDDSHAYRIRPEPVRETVKVIIWHEDGDTELGTGTIELIDGKPDYASIKMEEL